MSKTLTRTSYEADIDMLGESLASIYYSFETDKDLLVARCVFWEMAYRLWKGYPNVPIKTFYTRIVDASIFATGAL